MRVSRRGRSSLPLPYLMLFSASSVRAAFQKMNDGDLGGACKAWLTSGTIESGTYGISLQCCGTVELPVQLVHATRQASDLPDDCMCMTGLVENQITCASLSPPGTPHPVALGQFVNNKYYPCFPDYYVRTTLCGLLSMIPHLLYARKPPRLSLCGCFCSVRRQTTRAHLSHQIGRRTCSFIGTQGCLFGQPRLQYQLPSVHPCLNMGAKCLSGTHDRRRRKGYGDLSCTAILTHPQSVR